jgi:hypothetical protein
MDHHMPNGMANLLYETLLVENITKLDKLRTVEWLS